MKARLTARAAADLEAIRDYLLPLNPMGAERVRAAIANTIEVLEDFPQSGRQTDVAGIRVIIVVRYSYVVYHLLSGTEIIIVHIRHGARDAPGSDELTVKD